MKSFWNSTFLGQQTRAHLTRWSFPRIHQLLQNLRHHHTARIVFSCRSRPRNASGTARSKVLRVRRYTSSGTWVDYFVCWNMVHLYYQFVAHYSCDNHRDGFHHCYLGSQTILAQDRHIPRSCGNIACAGCCFYCDLPRVTAVIYCGQRLHCPPIYLLFP
jgi:hypothetical protein